MNDGVMLKIMRYFGLSVVVSLMMIGCAPLGKNYTRPQVTLPQEYKSNKNWKIATPSDYLPKGEWWKLFEDSTLNDLQDRVQENQNVKAAVARVEQARAMAKISQSEFLPSVDLNPSYEKRGTSGNLQPFALDKQVVETFSLPFDLSYEVDLWGRVRRQNEASKEEFRSTIADYNNVLLSLRCELARTYFILRALDTEIDILRQTIELREESLRLTRSLYENGQVSQLDEFQAETELSTVQSEEFGLRKTRRELENAIAVLVGELPSEFSLKEGRLDHAIPVIPTGFPSQLLERRPDISVAERKMAAANARVGAAQAAYFPLLSINASAGISSSQFENLFEYQSRTWGLGPQLSLPIFHGGSLKAEEQRRFAQYEEMVAHYKQQILIALKEVEDGISGIEILKEQSKAIDRSVKSAAKSSDVAQKRYGAGLTGYLDVVNAERIALQVRRQSINNTSQQLITAVLLIKALGGSW